MGFQDLSLDISVSSLVIIAASDFEISCRKKKQIDHRQTEV